MKTYDTTTVQQLAQAYAEGRVDKGATARLRTATFALLPLGHIAVSRYNKERFDITFTKFKGFPTGAAYLPVAGNILIDVTGASLHDNEKYETRGWRDMYLNDLDQPYKERR